MGVAESEVKEVWTVGGMLRGLTTGFMYLVLLPVDSPIELSSDI